MISQLAYVSPHEYRFDERARSVVCTVSSDRTVRAWDLQEVNCPLGRESWFDSLNAGQVGSAGGELPPGQGRTPNCALGLILLIQAGAPFCR